MPPARKEVVEDLGEPAFRADQLSRHYFERFEDDARAMTDLPLPVSAGARRTVCSRRC